MQRKGARLAAVVMTAILLILVNGCGSNGDKKPAASGSVSATTQNLAAGSSSASESPKNGVKPNTCSLLNSSTANILAGIHVTLLYGGPQYYGPNIVCEYAGYGATRADNVDISLVATYLSINGKPYNPENWNQLVQGLDRLKFPVVKISALDSPGYFGWSLGPSRVERSSDTSVFANCGFADHGYGFNLGGRWSGGVTPPSRSAMVGTCERIATTT
jgi:hypothetical protein